MEIGIWGDSVTYGEWDEAGLGWVGRFRNAVSGERHIGVYNRGVCGDTTADILKRFEVEAESIEPNKIVFAVGLNDLKHPFGKTESNVPIGEFEKNMIALLRLAKARTSDVTVVSATPSDESVVRPAPSSAFMNGDILSYNAVLERLAAQEGVAYVDVFAILDPTDLHDGIHPNGAGYEKMCGAIAPRISP